MTRDEIIEVITDAIGDEKWLWWHNFTYAQREPERKLARLIMDALEQNDVFPKNKQ